MAKAKPAAFEKQSLQAAQRDFIKGLNSIQSRTGQALWSLFQDWLTFAFCQTRTMTQLMLPPVAIKNEEQYMRVIKKHFPHVPAEVPMDDDRRFVIRTFTQLFETFIIYAHENRFDDFLGGIVESVDGLSSGLGQFFTPVPIANFMARITLDQNMIQERIKDAGYFLMEEPACGAGIFMLETARIVHELGFEPAEVMAVSATDLDVQCFQMSFLQCAFAGISAVCYHGNSLSREIFDYAPTSYFALKALTEMRAERGEQEPTVSDSPPPEPVRDREPVAKRQPVPVAAVKDEPQLKLF